jgi:ElaA protein
MERVEPRLSPYAIRSARFNELRPDVLYGILRLRSEVFVVEQSCVYLDTDGRDIEPTTTHWWIEDPRGAVIAYLRLLRTPRHEGSEIGRVVTAAGNRNRGYAQRLVEQALRVAPRPVRINAQTRLVSWYTSRFGFIVNGEEFDEDGIAHTPMLLVS